MGGYPLKDRKNLKKTIRDLSQNEINDAALEAKVDARIRTGAGTPSLDEDDDVQIGTLYVDTATGDLYVCTDATSGAPVWASAGGGGSGDPISIVDQSATAAANPDQIDLSSTAYVIGTIVGTPASGSGGVIRINIAQLKIQIGLPSTVEEDDITVTIGSDAVPTNTYWTGTLAQAQENPSFDLDVDDGPGGSGVGIIGIIVSVIDDDPEFATSAVLEIPYTADDNAYGVYDAP